MDDKPLEKFLDRDLSVAAAKNMIDVASPILQKLVNYATNAFGRCCASTSRKPDKDAAVLMLYYHILEMTDSIDVLISKSCPEPAHLLLRSSFEALLSIEYILETKQKYVERSLSWLVNYVHNRLNLYESIDPGAPKGESMRQFLKQHKNEAFQSIKPPDAKAAIENLKPFLSKPHIKPIEKEFANCKRNNKRRNCRWYQLFQGPQNLRELSNHLKRGAEYQFLYKQWSSIIHAQDPSRFLALIEGSIPGIGPLRDSRNINNVAYFSAYFLWDATRSIMNKFRPKENIQPFHKRFAIEMNLESAFRILKHR